MIPTWATQAMEAAGVDVEGWVYDPEDDCMEYVALPHGGICLNKRGEISVNDVSNITVDGAFLLADRLRRALSGEPDPRVAELEAEVEFLADALRHIVNPVRHILNNIPEGRVIDGAGAVRASESAAYLKGVASDALDKYLKEQRLPRRSKPHLHQGGIGGDGAGRAVLTDYPDLVI